MIRNFEYSFPIPKSSWATFLLYMIKPQLVESNSLSSDLKLICEFFDIFVRVNMWTSLVLIILKAFMSYTPKVQTTD